MSADERALGVAPEPAAAENASIGVAFLARGLHDDWQHAFQRFVSSYRKFPAGRAHQLYVIFKGYRDARHLEEGREYFAEVAHRALETHDEGFDIGCYQRMAHEMPEEFVCFLNTKSEILSPDWLCKLARPFENPGVGLVGNTGSYESIHFRIPEIPIFPNAHIRTNAFLIRRALFSSIADQFEIRSKNDGWMFECGPDGLSQQVRRRGLQILVVNGEGDAYEPARWPWSKTYRVLEANPLIGDDTSRAFAAADPVAQRDMNAITWGPAAAEPWVRPG